MYFYYCKYHQWYWKSVGILDLAALNLALNIKLRWPWPYRKWKSLVGETSYLYCSRRLLRWYLEMFEAQRNIVKVYVIPRHLYPKTMLIDWWCTSRTDVHQVWCQSWKVPSGKLLHNYGKIHHFYWEIHYFYGHFQ